ncbi:MAG: FHA domain-containing protein [Labilithrix sp.]|nr:FHA domain-containing protein [Labilithrix sp.]
MDADPAVDDANGAFLLFLSGARAGTRVVIPRVDEAPFVIGRSVDAGLSLFAHGEIARAHCALRAGPAGGHVIEDCKSTNGTFVNRVRVHRTALADGDEIQVGTILFRYFCGPGAAERVEAARGALARVDP